jgi:uncharacterized phage infection (PIP) family protein YhgE
MPDQVEALKVKVAELDKSVQRLQNIAGVIAAVAAIFGIGGAFGVTAFSGAKEQLSQLQTEIGDVDQTVSRAVSQREKEAAERLNETAKQLRQQLLVLLQESNDKLSKWGRASPQVESEKDVAFGGQSGRSDVKYCPDGQYVVGMQVIDSDTGRFCVSCINGVRFICRPIGR